MKIPLVFNEKVTLTVIISEDGYVHGLLKYSYRNKHIKMPLPAIIDKSVGYFIPTTIKQRLSRSLTVKILFPELVS